MFPEKLKGHLRQKDKAKSSCFFCIYKFVNYYSDTPPPPKWSETATVSNLRSTQSPPESPPKMSHIDERDNVPLNQSSQSDIDEIENLITASVQFGPSTVLPASPPSPTPPSIPVSTSPFIPSNLPPPPQKQNSVPSAPSAPPPPSNSIRHANSGLPQSSMSGFGPLPNTLTEPVWDTVKRDLSRIVSNLKLVVFPNPYREDPGKALRDWDLWGPFFFIVFLGLTLSWSASVKKVFSFIHNLLSCRMFFPVVSHCILDPPSLIILFTLQSYWTWS